MSTLTVFTAPFRSVFGLPGSDAADLWRQNFPERALEGNPGRDGVGVGAPTQGGPINLPQLTGNARGLQSYRLQQLSFSLSAVEIAASRTEIAGAVTRTAQILARRVTIDLQFSTSILERYAESITALQDADPELLADFLALVKLLDEKTPAELDAFFERLRNILSGDAGAAVVQPEGAAFDVNVPVPAEGETGVQVREFFIHVRISVVQIEVSVTTQVQKGDPLVLDLDGDGIELTSVEHGREFDLDGDGISDRTAFVTGGDAFLALDRNGNGSIDDGAELFGEHHGAVAVDGFAELARMDDNADGLIDGSDSVFKRLVLFDGYNIRNLADAGITSLSTLMTSFAHPQVNGNDIVGAAAFQRADGTAGGVYETLLNYL